MSRRVGVLALTVVVLAAGGCSDDVTCPDPDDAATKPFVRAFIRQTAGEPDTTFATLTVGGDPVPTFVVASVNYREFEDADLVEGPLLYAELEDGVVIWQPGTPCTLRVSTDEGFARGSAVVPQAVTPTAPASIVLGDSLVVSWSPADDADYYALRAVLRAGSDSLVVEMSVDDTTAVVAAGAITMAGDLTGAVAAVSGPPPEAGAQGNITGEGWGFFSVSYETGASGFSTTVLAPGAR